MKSKLTNILIALTLLLCTSCGDDKIEIFNTGNITGKVVTKGDNVPIENVKISTSPETSTVFTDENGEFLISDIISASYSVKAEKDLFLTKFEGISLINSEVINVIFELDADTSNNKPPNDVQLIEPANNSLNTELEVELSWSAADVDEDIITYSIEVFNNQNSDVLMIENVLDTLYTIPNLKFNTKYFWQIKATDQINEPVLSEVFNFTTKPFPNNRFLYTRVINGNNVIFSADENGNEIQLTSTDVNSWRPRKGKSINKIAFYRTVGNQTHVFIMDTDGSNEQQVTNNITVNGFNLEELDFAWKDNDSKILFPNFDKLYEIGSNGSSLAQLYQTTNGNFISEIDWNQSTQQIALKTNDANGYNVEIFTINTSGAIQHLVTQGKSGAFGGLNFSFSGDSLLYTHDVSSNENATYRQLDTNIFIYNFTSSTATNVSTDKKAGTNDLDPRFSPNEAQIIFVNTSNDNVSQKDLQILDIGLNNGRKIYTTHAKMIDWN
ncbi:hypothetical protein K8354_04775 [Polaribacter litorisediminis]|uniref:carboxypeptidase regulatory-like domain-containing protein n=1 Tax=Polaribacter litorisediminis TaxID=1908341 RepID=UPI001CBC5171|nr:carboxypeptidase regulatory-like domain-containing protein [Polaribacter litorisediminis]UAM99140.1 hypothetical protein K8354_04775 [Polaribacter litorisediminis]